MKSLPIAVAAVLSAVLLSACGTSDYCQSAQDNQEALNAFGEERTSAAYSGYAGALRDVAASAPEDVADDLTDLADRTQAVVDAQEQVGLDLADMGDRTKTADLSSEQLEMLNDTYKSFNATSDKRTTITRDLISECDLTLQ